MTQRPQETDLKLDNLTREDLKKIERSMKQPGFMGLLNEYMIEISDPKNKNEYDEYLRQMEREKELPKNMKIIEIKPHFCFRTFIVSQKNKKHQMKFFINMCQSEYLDKPNCQPSTGENGFTGYNWKIPNSMGKIRYDQDKKGNPCQVVDIAFHPDTYYFATRKEFKEMMINIALEAAEKQLGQRKETLSRDYVILQNVKCKGVDGKPALMPIRYIEGKVYNKSEGPTSQPQRDLQGRETKLQKQISRQKEDFDKQKQKSKEKQKQEQKLEQDAGQDEKLIVDLQSGIQRPKFRTILTYPVDYSEFIDSPYTNKKKIPTAFNLEFQLPRAQSMQEIANQTLEINQKKIILKVAEKYFIDLQWEDLKLKYKLLTASAKAKFDKKKKSLRIIIPIDQTIRYQTQPAQGQKLVEPIPQPQTIVQSETWKNKILQFSQPSVTVKSLTSQEKDQNEKSSLVQQIDEEDIVEQIKSEKNADKQVKVQDEEDQQTSTKPAQKFTLGKYYIKQKTKQMTQFFRIGHIFQETSDKIVIVFQLKNYKKQEIKIIVNKKEILIQWKVGNLIKYEHLVILDQLSQKIVKFQVVFRVGFIAVMLQKGQSVKGKYFQKQCLIQVNNQGESQEQKFIKFLEYFDMLQKQQKQREIDQKTQIKENQDLSKELQATKKQKSLNTEQQEKLRNEIKEQIETKQINDPISHQPISLPLKNGLVRALQPHFINFLVQFIQELD